jgi:hypothetical protein
MIVKEIRDEDFTSYKKSSMVVGFPSCSFKCCKEGNFPIEVCQNCSLAKAKSIEITSEEIINRYLSNPITSAIVCGGLEPMDSFDDLKDLIMKLRQVCEDDVVIFSGYNKEEIADKIKELSKYKNIIIKFGRYIPNENPHYDKVLGVKLASNNQRAERIS